jgi:hypothetical protein
MATPNPLTYNGLVTQVCLLAPYQYSTVSGVVTPLNQPEFTALIPQMLNYAEQRIQRDLELLANEQPVAYTANAGFGSLNIPMTDFVVIEGVTATVAGANQMLTQVSRDYYLACWPVGSGTGPPTVWAIMWSDANMQNTSIALGPVPDLAYPVTVFGQRRMPSLATFGTPGNPSAGTSTTWLSTWLPDLLVVACMIYVSGYQRDFGRQSDDPQMAQSYEQQYQTLLDSIDKEEFRKRGEADAWTPRKASPIATPTRT